MGSLDGHKVYKDHLKRFNLALRRRWPLCSGIWKLEFQTRGAPHYYFMLFGLSHEPGEQLRSWTRQTWYHIAHNGDQHLGSAAVEVDPIRKLGGAMGYFAKHLGKGDPSSSRLSPGWISRRGAEDLTSPLTWLHRFAVDGSKPHHAHERRSTKLREEDARSFWQLNERDLLLAAKSDLARD